MTNNPQTIAEYQSYLREQVSKVFPDLSSEDLERKLKSLLEYGYNEADIADFEHVQSYGGEGLGEEYWVVFRVKDKTFRINGYYSSYTYEDYYVHDHFDWQEVAPKEVTRTEWVAA